MWHIKAHNGLKSIRLSDGPHGLRKVTVEKASVNDSVRATCFPTMSCMASSWDCEAVGLMAGCIAEQAKAQNVSMVLGPGINIKRSPLCGRNFEYFSEDPFLTSRLSSAYIDHMQKKNVAVCLKHFAANNQETHRMTGNSIVDQRTLREIYLRAFEYCVRHAKPAAIMASYNKVNGVSACENKWLLTDVLRNEWKFEGAVISDWGASIDLPACIEAGMDLEMPDSKDNHIKSVWKKMLEEKNAAVHGKSNSSPMTSAVIRAEENISRLQKNFPPPYTIRSCTNEDYMKLLEEHHQTAKLLAEQSAVLLKNENHTLPLNVNTAKKILAIGTLAEHFRFEGGGSSHINASAEMNCIQALEKCGFEVEYRKGYHSKINVQDNEMYDRAVSAADKAMAEGVPVVFFGGLPEYAEGEGFDRKDIELPDLQKNLIEKLHVVKQKHSGGKIIFAGFGGSAFAIPHLEMFSAVLMMYLSGESGSEAFADLLCGKSNPCGKLAETFPLCASDIPCRDWFGGLALDVEYRESIFTGYRYYDTFGIPVQFCFGHGLSYTTFEYSNLSVEKKNGCSFTVTLNVKNTGSVDGKEIVELYIKAPEGNRRILRAARELKGFCKIDLAPGETKKVQFQLDDDSFNVWSAEKNKFVVPDGVYTIQAGSSLNDIRLEHSVAVEGDGECLPDETIPECYLNRNGKLNVRRGDFEKLFGGPLPVSVEPVKGQYTVKHSLHQLARSSAAARAIKNVAVWALCLLNPGKSVNSPEMKMMISVVVDGSLDCISNQSGGLLPYRCVEALVLGANGQHARALKKLFLG